MVSVSQVRGPWPRLEEGVQVLRPGCPHRPEGSTLGRGGGEPACHCHFGGACTSSTGVQSHITRALVSSGLDLALRMAINLGKLGLFNALSVEMTAGNDA